MVLGVNLDAGGATCAAEPVGGVAYLSGAQSQRSSREPSRGYRSYAWLATLTADIKPPFDVRGGAAYRRGDNSRPITLT